MFDCQKQWSLDFNKLYKRLRNEFVHLLHTKEHVLNLCSKIFNKKFRICCYNCRTKYKEFKSIKISTHNILFVLGIKKQSNLIMDQLKSNFSFIFIVAHAEPSISLKF